MTALLKVEDRGSVRTLTMNRPDKLNALNHELSEGLLNALLEADHQPDVRVIILAGAGRAFCAGADINEFTDLNADNPDAVHIRAELTTRLHTAFFQVSKPIIGAVQGYAMGGGCGLALACDMVVAASGAKFGYPEVKRGIVGAVVMPNLVRQVGRKAAFELLTVGGPITAERAFALQMVNQVVPDENLLTEANALANRVAEHSADAVQATKRLFYRVTEVSLSQGLEAGRDTNMIMRSFRVRGHK